MKKSAFVVYKENYHGVGSHTLCVCLSEQEAGDAADFYQEEEIKLRGEDDACNIWWEDFPLWKNNNK